LDVGTIDMLTRALTAYEGAIVAITHNAVFAAGLNATHVLRVEGGAARLSVNYGLAASDFDHAPGGGGAAPASASSAPAAGVPRKTPKKLKGPSEEEQLEALRAAARAERFAAAGNALPIADARPKSKLERQAAQRAAEAAEKQAKADAKKRGYKK
jgi:hypothetical protein